MTGKKYSPLEEALKKHHEERVSMTFSEIERIIADDLPESAFKHRPWWSNNPSNSVITNAWLNAGFKTEQVDIAGRKLVFRRARVEVNPKGESDAVVWERHHARSDARNKPAGAESSGQSSPSGVAEAARPYQAVDKPISGLPERCRHPAFGSMKGLIQIAPGVDLTEPAADPDSWKSR